MTHPDAYQTVNSTSLPCGHSNEFYDTVGETLEVYCELCKARTDALEEAAHMVETFPEYSDYRNGFADLVDRNDAAGAVRALKDSPKRAGLVIENVEILYPKHSP